MLSNRSTRQALFEDSWNRAEHGGPNDTRDTIARLAQLRAQKAQLLGFPNFAAWKLEDQMAKTPEAVLKFLDALVPGSTANAVSQAKEHPGAHRQARKAASSCSPGTGASTPSRFASEVRSD